MTAAREGYARGLQRSQRLRLSGSIKGLKWSASYVSMNREIRPYVMRLLRPPSQDDHGGRAREEGRLSITRNYR